MRQIAWFKRNFLFDFDQNIFPSIIERLEGTPIRLEFKMKMILNEYLTVKLDNNWSILEHLGHLNDL